MSEWCHTQGLRYLFTAHHRDDQIETFFMRLSHGSGVDGLASMDAVASISPNLALVRPLLSVAKVK